MRVKKDPNKLFVCAVAWDHERDVRNVGFLEFYMSKKALKRCHPCWRECGIYEISCTPVEKRK